ncbi:uncharacterized protein LOC123004918 [Tribolium madens]|uniref:uncharacterized protein LOC123004918 n=1 Tax=Tribolium madens TaxID=41895 RepID=UPI001CF75FE7|nr:uncharacterized protein LOC123004918 [Tribolium madens]XP_044254383.1 uncharacterized protein LOC123004918 [Tribolium madens]
MDELFSQAVRHIETEIFDLRSPMHVGGPITQEFEQIFMNNILASDSILIELENISPPPLPANEDEPQPQPEPQKIEVLSNIKIHPPRARATKDLTFVQQEVETDEVEGEDEDKNNEEEDEQLQQMLETTKAPYSCSVEEEVRELKRRLEERKEILANKRMLAESILNKLCQEEVGFKKKPQPS